MPSGVEVFANCPSAVTTGTSGTTAPAALTVETWTMGTGYTTFPVAQTTSAPNNYFFIRDPADTTNEIILVTVGGSSSTSWTVTRGYGGTTPHAHATGATFVQVVAPATLQNFRKTSSASTTAVTISGTSETILATYTPTSDEIAAGSSWAIEAFGPVTTSSTATILTLTMRWGGISGTSTSTMTTGSTGNAPAIPTSLASGSAFDINGTFTLISATSAVSNLTLVAGAGSGGTTPMLGMIARQNVATISGNGPLVLTAYWSATGCSLTALAPKIVRVA